MKFTFQVLGTLAKSTGAMVFNDVKTPYSPNGGREIRCACADCAKDNEPTTWRLAHTEDDKDGNIIAYGEIAVCESCQKEMGWVK